MANAAHVYQFADDIIAHGDYEAGDRIYVVNQILSRLKADDIALLDTHITFNLKHLLKSSIYLLKMLLSEGRLKIFYQRVNS